MISFAASLIFASILAGIPLFGLIRRIEIFESFVIGGKSGIEVALKIIPFIVGMYVAIGMLKVSGFFEILATFASPLLSLLGMPSEVLPLALMRPFSGSGAIAILSQIIEEAGADSLASLTAATILGSTETTFYVIAVYFGAIRVRHYRYALTVGLLADLVGIIASVMICQWFVN